MVFCCTLDSLFISIHAPHEGVRPEVFEGMNYSNISIHAPHEGVRLISPQMMYLLTLFQSTHPTRGCDVNGNLSAVPRDISIHAPHEGVRLKQDILML